MTNKKVIAVIALASTFLVMGSAFAVTAVDSDLLNPQAAETHHLVWESEPTMVGDKFIMYGDENGEIEVDSTNAVLGGKVLALGGHGTFENISPIGRISNVELTYSLGESTTPHDGSTQQVLKAQFGYMIAPDNPTVYYQDAQPVANSLVFSDAKPSFIRFISTTEEVIKIDKIEISYQCSAHDYVNAITDNGVYMVGKGSFVKNNADWAAIGGTLMTRQESSKQYKGTLSLKKGDRVSFQKIENHVISYPNWALKTNGYDVFKEGDGHNIEALLDCKLTFFLKDNAELYLSIFEPEVTTPYFKIVLVNSNSEGKGFTEGKVPYLVGIDDNWSAGVAFGSNYTYKINNATAKNISFKIVPLNESSEPDFNFEVNAGNENGGNYTYNVPEYSLNITCTITFDFAAFGISKITAAPVYTLSYR